MTTGSRDFKVVLGLLLFGVTGGSAFIFVKQLVGETTPLQVVTGRVAMAAVPLLAIMFVAGSTPKLSMRFLMAVSGLAAVDTVIPYLLIAWAQIHINSSTAALLVSTMPMFSTLIAARTSEGSSITGSTIAGMASGFAGVAVLAGPSAYDSASATGMLAVVGAAFCYAAGAAYSRPMMQDATPLGLSAIKLAVASCFLLPATAAVDGLAGYASLSPLGWLALVEVGFISTGLGRWVYQWIIARAGSVRASLVTYLVPLVAVFLAWAVLDEPIGAAMLGGAMLVLGGITAVMYGQRLSSWLASGWSAITNHRADVEAIAIPNSRRGGQQCLTCTN